MGIIRKLQEWREKPDGTLFGPKIRAESVEATDDVRLPQASEGDDAPSETSIAISPDGELLLPEKTDE